MPFWESWFRVMNQHVKLSKTKLYNLKCIWSDGIFVVHNQSLHMVLEWECSAACLFIAYGFTISYSELWETNRVRCPPNLLHVLWNIEGQNILANIYQYDLPMYHQYNCMMYHKYNFMISFWYFLTFSTSFAWLLNINQVVNKFCSLIYNFTDLIYNFKCLCVFFKLP